MPASLKFLNALRAFEVSARLGSFTRAADELGVTPAAVGQQVRMLEDYLGQKLFLRTAKGLRATVPASSALADLHSGFDRLEAGFTLLQGAVLGNRLSVSVAPALASKWLAPRLQGLYERCPDIELRMDASLRLADLQSGEFDLVVRYDAGQQDGLTSLPLFDEYVLPVCAPALCQPNDDIETADNLLSLPLLHIEGETSDTGVPTWRDWARQFGVQGDRLDRGPRYPQSAMAIQAALDGQGILLCGMTLVLDDLITGRLITPFSPGIVVKAHYVYRVIFSPVRQRMAIQNTFVDWIQAEAKKSQVLIDKILSDARLDLIDYACLK